MRGETQSRIAVEQGRAILFRGAAVSAFATVAITVVQTAVFAVAPPPSFQPTPSAVAAIFGLLRSKPLLGFVELDGLMLLDYVLIAVVFLALYVALRWVEPVLAMLGVVLALVAITAYFSANRHCPCSRSPASILSVTPSRPGKQFSPTSRAQGSSSTIC